MLTLPRACPGGRHFLALAAFAVLTLSLVLGARGADAQTGLQLDGVNDHVTFGQATSTLGAANFTIEVWFKRTGAGVVTSTGSGANAANGHLNVVPLLAKGRGEGDGTTVDCNYFLGIQNTPNVVLVADYEDFAASNNNHAITGTTVLRNDVWYHAAATYDGATFRLYLNGNLEASAATTAQPRFDSIQHASLGTAMNSTGVAAGFFAGVLDEARVWSVARSQADIRSGATMEIGSGAGLLGRWGLNDGAGNAAANSVAGSPNGTLVNFGGSQWVTGSPFAHAYALLLNGSSGYATFGDPAALDLAAFTVETWFRRDGAGTTTTTGTGGIPDALPLVTHGAPEAEASTVDMNFFLGLKSTGVLCADFEEGAGGASPGLNHPVTGTTVVANGAWHHAAATYDGTTWKLYLDGLLEATAVVGQPAQSATVQRAALGTALTSTGATNGFFLGVLDEARVWSGARTQAQIQATINSQLTSPMAGLVARWGLDEGGGRVVRDTSGTAAHGTLNPASPTTAWGWVAGAPFDLTFAPPADPTGLTATTITHARIDLAWTDNASTETGFEIERSTTGIAGTYTLLTTVPANTQSYSDLAVTLDTEYCYRVRATSGAGPSGYAAPACATTPAIAASAVDFGGNTYASFGDPASLRLTQFTLEMWMRRDGAGVGTDTGASGIPDAIPLLAKGRADVEEPARDINYLFGIKAATGVLCADFEEAASGATPSGNHPVLGTNPILAGSGWHHVAATYDGATWKLYLDGFQEASLAVGQPVANASNVAVSLATALRLDNSASGFFDGAVDEVRIWNVARTQAEIQATANVQITTAQAGLVARWGLDEGTGTAINGSAGTTVNGAITGASYAWVGSAPFDLSFTPPSSPQDLNASAISNSQIDLSWTDASTNEAGFEIERSTSGIGGTYTLLTTVAANSTTYSDLGLSASTEYCYRIRAVNGGGASSHAGPDCATTAPAPSYALDFGGSTYASFGDPAALDLSTFTIEMWLRRDAAGTGADTGTNGIPDAIPLVTKGRGEAEDPVRDINYFFGIKASTHVLCADFEEAAGGATPSLNHPVLGTTPIAVGSGWHHVAVTYDGATWKLYVDGLEDGSAAVGQPPASASNVAVALATSLNSTNATAGFFEGAMDEVRVWNVARTLAQIQSTANAQITTPEAGLVARWALDEGAGAAINGTAGTTVNGTITGPNFAWIAPAPFNLSFNLPPDAPALVEPANGATNASLSPSLTVTVSDPEASNLTVTWYGRAVTTTPGPDFTLIGLPDTQYYTGQLNGGTNAIFKSQTSWIATNRATRNIRYVATLGDCVEHGDAGDGVNPEIEWMRADTAFTYIESEALTGLPDGIPYGVTVGNHDQSPIGNPDGTTTYYNQYFGVSRFQDRDYYGGHYGTNNDNWYDLFSASGMDFIVISFEYDTTPDQAVLDWADALLVTHSNRRGIVLTHNMLGTGNPGAFSTQGQAIYNALSDRPNLFLLLGGHVPGEGRRQDTFGGVTVNSILADYQSRTNGGNGWLRILTFSPASNSVQVQTYSPWLDQFETDGDSQFSFTYPMSSAEPFQAIGSLSNVTSGSSVSMTWPGLSLDTQYEWYATVSDGSVTTTGPTWSFTTAPTVGVETGAPREIALAPLHPNPAFGSVQMSFSLPSATQARLSVFDLQGREVAVLVDGVVGAGRHPISWDGRTAGGTLRSGLYVLRLQTPGRVDVRKMVWSR